MKKSQLRQIIKEEINEISTKDIASWANLPRPKSVGKEESGDDAEKEYNLDAMRKAFDVGHFVGRTYKFDEKRKESEWQDFVNSLKAGKELY